MFLYDSKEHLTIFKRDGNANFSKKLGFLKSRKVLFSQVADWLPPLEMVRYWLVKAAPCLFCYIYGHMFLRKFCHCLGKF